MWRAVTCVHAIGASVADDVALWTDGTCSVLAHFGCMFTLLSTIMLRKWSCASHGWWFVAFTMSRFVACETSVVGRANGALLPTFGFVHL